MQALSVGAVVSFLREVLEANEIFSDLWIVGEVSSYSRSGVGHRYFSLRDSGGVLRSVLFRDTMPGMALKDGDRVLAHGRLSLYTQRGDLQFICDFVRPEGVGILAAKFEELRLRLEREGLFAASRKRPLPRFPMRIGLVTSPTGAAIQDVRTVLERRWPLASVLLAPAAVQGNEAPFEIASALRTLALEPGLDLIILARGGGASEDLSAFNTEQVARAIHASPCPVVAGVGHERDETIADFVADLRAPTPSAAAERAVPDVREVAGTLRVLDRAMASASREAVGSRARTVDALLRRADHTAPDAGMMRHRVAVLARGIETNAARELATRRSRVESARATLDALDVRATLSRGFAIVQHAQSRKVVSSTRKVRAGDRLAVAVADGAFFTEVS